VDTSTTLDEDSRTEVTMGKRRGRTAYTEEFRREAVRLIERDPSQIPQIARGLGVHRETLQAWWQRTRVNQDGPIVAPARVLTLEEENRRLRQENARLTEERDILKKGSSRNSGKGGADFQEKVGIVPKSVRHSLEHFDLVVDALE
jgi:transposase